MADKPAPKRTGLAVRQGLAWAAVLWERVWRALWPGSGIIGLFLVLALFDVLPALAGWLHTIVLVVLATALGWSLWRGFRDFRLPTSAEARRRLEDKSGLKHRPLTLMIDEQVTGEDDPGARAVWAAHRERVLKSLGRLRIGAPSPGLAGRDPWAFRGAIAVLLVAALMVSWGDGWSRIARAGMPVLDSAAPVGPATVEAWITPPAYTGLAPKFLSGAQANVDPINAPARSKLLVRVQGGRGKPALKLGKDALAFKDMAGSSFQYEGTIDRTGRLIVTQRGKTIGSWAINVRRDTAPSIGFRRPPSKTPRSTLRLDYEAKDDYGVAKVRALIRRADKPAKAGTKGETLVVKLPGGSTVKTLKRSSYHDLTAHIWAGLPVTIMLEAEDAIGQKGRSAPIKMVLPERIFRHPVARALVDARKDLIREPGDRKVIAEIVGELSIRPDRYRNDIVAFLSMRSAAARLLLDGTPEGIKSVSKLLWDTALRIEDGRLSLAERDLRDAQKRLAEALNNKNLTDRELQKLIDQLQKALDRFMRQLAEQMRKNPEAFAKTMPLDKNAMVLEQRDLNRMLQQLRNLSRSGNKEAARQMLQALRQMLENLRGMAQRPQQQRGRHPAAKIMRDMQGLIRRQQELMDRTFRQQQQGRQGQRQGQQRQGQRPGQQQGQPRPGQQQGQSLAREQEALRRQLGDLMRRLDEMMGGIPKSMGKAEREMKGAREALRQGQPGSAVRRQGRALQHLRSGQQRAMRQMMQRFGRQLGMMPRRPGWQRGRRRDPFGRNPNNGTGGTNTNDVKIPEEADTQKAREILEELRRRAGERERPKLERDYIDRLLRQF